MDAAVDAAVADGTWPIRCLGFVVDIGCNITFGASIASFFVILVVPFPGFCVTASHADVPPDAHTAALFGDDPADIRAFCQSRELFGTVDSEWLGSHLKAEVNMGLRSHWASNRFVAGGSGCLRGRILIPGLFDLLI